MVISSNQTVANSLRAAGKTVRNAAAVVIRPSPSADTRSADHPVTEDELRESTTMHIVDGVMAGKARKGECRPDVLGAGILERAYANTQKMISDAVRVGK